MLYGGSAIILLLLAVFSIVFSFFYKPPTCFDGLQNGDETGVDCGGSCVKLCQNAFIPIKVSWGGAKFEEVAPSVYNLASYIENPNTNVAALNVPYKISVFDNKGVFITDRIGMINVPAHRNVLVFYPSVNVSKRIPARATFEFMDEPQWFKSHDSLAGALVVVDKKYEENENNSSLEITLENKSLLPLRDVEIGVVLYDKDKNTIGFSKTVVDEIKPKGGREMAPFTWPMSRNGKVVSVEVLPAISPEKDI